MITHRYKQIEKERMAQFHLHLHRPATLEDMPGANDHRQVVSAQPILLIRRVVIRVARRPQDHVDRDPALEALLAQREPLQCLQPVLLGGAVHRRVSEDKTRDAGKEYGGFAGSRAVVWVGGLEFPGVRVSDVEQTGEVVALVEELEDAGQDLRLSGRYEWCLI